jgi:hypothetical protein
MVIKCYIAINDFFLFNGYSGYRGIFMEKDKEKMVQIRVSLPEDYRRLFKSICTEQGTDMSKRITELVENELKKAGKISQI